MNQTQSTAIEDSRDIVLSEVPDDTAMGSSATRSPAEEVTAKGWVRGGAHFYLSRPADSREEIDVSAYALQSERVWGESYKERFERLKNEWKRETAHVASPVKRAQHPAYQNIIGMGLPAVPLILDDLREGREHWFWALRAITGANPVSDEERGNLQKMTSAWIRWAEENDIGENIFSKHAHEDEPFRGFIPQPEAYDLLSRKPERYGLQLHRLGSW